MNLADLKKGDQVMIAKNNKFIKFVIFSHWKSIQSKYWFDISGNKYSINDFA